MMTEDIIQTFKDEINKRREQGGEVTAEALADWYIDQSDEDLNREDVVMDARYSIQVVDENPDRIVNFKGVRVEPQDSKAEYVEKALEKIKLNPREFLDEIEVME